MKLSKSSFRYRWWLWVYSLTNDTPQANPTRTHFYYKLSLGMVFALISWACVWALKLTLAAVVVFSGFYWKADGRWQLHDPLSARHGLWFPLLTSVLLGCGLWYALDSWVPALVGALVPFVVWVASVLQQFGLWVAKHYPESYARYRKTIDQRVTFCK